MKIKYCSNCGKELEEDSEYCTYCGHKVIKAVPKESKNLSMLEKQSSRGHMDFELASTGKRFINLAMDYLLIYIAIYIVQSVILVLGTVYVGNNIVDSTAYDITYNALIFIIFFLYYFGLETIYGKTFGKLLTGTKTIDEDGNKPSPGTIAKRTLCRFIPFEALSYLTKKPYGWHDSIPKVRVVNIVRKK